MTDDTYQERILNKMTYRTDTTSFTIKIIRLGFYVGPVVLEISGARPFMAYSDISRIAVSPNGKRVAFCATYSDETKHVCVDNEQGPAIEELCSRIFFSSDSRQISYAARILNSKGAHSYVVIVNSKIEHEQEFIFGFDAMLDAPGPKFKDELVPSETSDLN